MYLRVCVRKCAQAHTPACVRPYVTHRAALPGIDVVTTKGAFDFYLQDQIALEEDHSDAASDSASSHYWKNNCLTLCRLKRWLDQC